MARRILPHSTSTAILPALLAVGEIVVNDTTGNLHVGDGSTLGGIVVGASQSAAALSTLASASGTEKIGFKAAGTGSLARLLSEKLGETLSVKDFGAIGTVVSIDDTAAIVAADLAASLVGKKLFFPAGVYNIDPIVAKAKGWYGDGRTTLKYRRTGLEAANFMVPLVQSQNVEEVEFVGLIFDGSVSADPTDWGNGNYDKFRGAAGLSVEYAKRARIAWCKAINTRQHGFRMVKTDGAVIEGCTSYGARGNFGDGFFLASVTRINVSRSYAENYTRIGFVVDAFGDDPFTCFKIVFDACFAKNGHHASFLYGGGEFNAGFWFEHSGDVSMTGCYAEDNTHRGINVCTGAKNNGFPGNQATVSIVNCHTVGGNWGIYTYSLESLPVVCKVIGCTAKLANTAFEGNALNAGDSFLWQGCHADYNAASLAGRGVAVQVVLAGASLAPFVVDNCTFSRWGDTATGNANLKDGGDNAATADVGWYFNPGGPVNLTVSACKHVGGDAVYVRGYNAAAHQITVRDTKTWLSRGGGAAGGSIDLIGCDIMNANLVYGETSRLTVDGGKVLGQFSAAATVHRFSPKLCAPSGGRVFLLSGATSKAAAAYIEGVRFERDFNANDDVIRIGFGTVAFSAIFQSILVVNTGTAASASNPFMRYAVGLNRYFNNVLLDGSITNITSLDSGGGAENTVPGVSKIALR